MDVKLPEEIELPLFTAFVVGAGLAPLVTGAALIEGKSVLFALALFPATAIGFTLLGAWFGLMMYLAVEVGLE